MLKNLLKYIICISSFTLFSTLTHANNNVIINGNENIDDEVIISIIKEYIDDFSDDNLNLIINKLEDNGNFENIDIYIDNQILYINLLEYKKIKDIKFIGNKRFNNEQIFENLNKNDYLLNYNSYYIDLFIIELKKMYLSFGYNQIDIEYETIDETDNFINLIFNITEGKISKVNNIYFIDNNSFQYNILYDEIKSRKKNILKFFLNSNYKSYVAKNDTIRLRRFYLENGFKDVQVELKTEFIFDKNKFNIYFYITEGKKHSFSDFNLNFDDINLNNEQINQINIILKNFQNKNKEKIIYNRTKTDFLKKKFSDYLFSQGLFSFEIDLMEKTDNELVSVLFKFNNLLPKYINKINIFGNIRTQDKVIRRELEFSEGDIANDLLIGKSNKNINNLDIFKEVVINEKYIDDDIMDIDIYVSEKPTGDFKVGISAGSLNGASFVTGLREKNIGGTGRNIDLSVNTTSDNTHYAFNIVEPYIFNKKINMIYGINYSQKDYHSSASYKTNIFNTNFGFKYLLSEDLYHYSVLSYDIKEYIITDNATVSSTIRDDSGTNAKIKLNNKLTFNKLNSYLRPSEGILLEYNNIYSPISNDKDGFLKNILIFKKFYNLNSDIFSIQSKIGNITSLQNKSILPDDNFSLGGRWLRGFDSYGAGPRNSRTSYIGGNNIFVSKLDYIKPLNKNSDNPIDIYAFTDIGKIWSNKNNLTHDKESIRSSYGFGIKFYSPIGPIGFSWAFPIQDESYDINRMFLFSIGNLN